MMIGVFVDLDENHTIYQRKYIECHVIIRTRHSTNFHTILVTLYDNIIII
jgi:hypothetical protein